MAKGLLGVAAFAVFLSGHASAQEGGIRFVRVPEAGQIGPRINIQITAEDMARQGAPEDVEEAPVVAAAPVAVVEHDGASAWFWATDVASQYARIPIRW